LKITHYLYNAFLLEADGVKVAIDPGQNLWLFKLQSLIPESEWPSVTHLVITHGDPDHHWQSDRVAKVSGAHVICGRGLTRVVDGSRLVVDPRGRALTSWVPFENLQSLEVGDSIELDDVSIEAVKAEHGPIAIPILGFTFRAQPGPNERVGIGAMGFRIKIGDTSVLNLGDTVLLPEWKDLAADVLMLPIGGLGQNTWTMDVDEALEAVKLISPRYVIPCHYNVPLLWKRKFAVADDQRFKREAELLGTECTILHYGESLTI
jgi:L-ascorbate metabolism protein UlaG (beta-lactamase superfamily)